MPVPAPAASSDRTPIRLRDTVMALLTWLAADTVAGIAILVAALVVMRQNGHLTPKQMVEVLPGDFTFLVTTTTVSAIVALSVLWRYTKRTKSFAVFFPTVPGGVIAWAVATGVIAVVVELALEAGIKHGLGIALPLSATEHALNPKSWVQLGVAIVCLAGIVPFFEEILFRGYILGWLKSVLPRWPAIVLSAVIFAAVHGLYVTRGGFSGWFGTGEIFALGVLLAWWAARTNSLRPGFAIHAVVNAAAFSLGFLLPGLYP